MPSHVFAQQMGRPQAPSPCRPHHGHPPQNQRIPLLCVTDHSSGHTEERQSLTPTRGATPKRGNTLPRALTYSLWVCHGVYTTRPGLSLLSASTAISSCHPREDPYPHRPPPLRAHDAWGTTDRASPLCGAVSGRAWGAVGTGGSRAPLPQRSGTWCRSWRGGQGPGAYSGVSRRWQAARGEGSAHVKCGGGGGGGGQGFAEPLGGGGLTLASWENLSSILLKSSTKGRGGGQGCRRGTSEVAPAAVT